MSRVLLDLLDAAWQLDVGRDTWLDGLVSAGSTALPKGVRGGAYHFRVMHGHPLLTAWCGENDLGSVPQRFHAETPAVDVLASYGLDVEGRSLRSTGGRPLAMVDLSRDRFPESRLPFPLADEYRGLGLDDALLFIVNDVGGEHFKLVLPLPRTRRDPDPRAAQQRMRDRYAPVARHIDRALRLRHLLATRPSVLAAELDERGRGEFRDPSQRAAIRAALEHTEHVRRNLDLETPDSSVPSWNRLLDGRYSIVRSRDANGKTRFLAIENDPEDARLRSLSALERDVVARVTRGESNKAIAIDLDLHSASIANVLGRAMRKLGVTERVHLARLERALAEGA